MCCKNAGAEKMRFNILIHWNAGTACVSVRSSSGKPSPLFAYKCYTKPQKRGLRNKFRTPSRKVLEAHFLRFGLPGQNRLQWGRSDLGDPAEWPKIGLLNRDFGSILSVFPWKNSKTQSSLNHFQSGPRRFTKYNFSGLAPIRWVLTGATPELGFARRPF